jgi:hypothetical protein
MKINIEIECTPDEARGFLGLPDLKPMQTAIMNKLEERMLDTMGNIAPAIMRAWLPYWMPFASTAQGGEGQRGAGNPAPSASQPANESPAPTDRAKSE